jgi:hypothetical protein
MFFDVRRAAAESNQQTFMAANLAPKIVGCLAQHFVIQP